MNWFLHGLYEAAIMLWRTLWALVLGYTISALLRVFVRREQMTEHFGRANLRSMGLATFFGAVSSSCSYAAAAAGKTAFRKGAALPVALAFMFASTNLVMELTAILWVLMGRLFVLAEFIGAFVLVAVMWLLVRLTLPKSLEDAARQHARQVEDEKSCCGGGMAEDDSETMESSHVERGAAVADAFRMDVAMVWKELLIGFLIAGFAMALVPNDWWQALFISNAPPAPRLIENSVVGPLIAMASFVCSCGNIPLASWLWANGISFGGVVAFIYGDLIVLPIILIYRKYYGSRAALYVTVVMFASMVIAGIAVDLLFSALGLVPHGPRPPSPMETAHFAWDYTAWLNLAAILFTGTLLLMRRRAGSAGHSHSD